MKTRPEYYILDEDHNAVPAEMLEWARWFEDIDNRRVAETGIGKFSVSTVCLGLDHNWSDQGPPHLFETMIFGSTWEEEDCWRCSTWAEAEEQHQMACDRVCKAVQLSDKIGGRDA